MRILTSKEMQDLDRWAIEQLGIPQIALMENAGKAAADEIKQFAGQRQSALVVAYKGNNGGDGFVAARHLYSQGYKVAVFLLCREEEISGSAKTNLAILYKLKVPIFSGHLSSLKKLLLSSEIVIDAIFGIGFKGKVKPNLAKAIDLINACRKSRSLLVVSLDVPSGINATTGKCDKHAINADLTVTFAYPKRGLFLFPAATKTGRIKVCDIGIPEDSRKGLPAARHGTKPQREIGAEFYLPKRPAGAHKGTCGKVLIIAGSRNMSGAACLTAHAALRSGAGLVYLAAPQSIQPLIAPKTKEVITLGLPDTKEGTLSLSAYESILKIKADVAAIGPGLTTHPETKALVKKLIVGLKVKTLILDADGLNAVADDLAVLRKSKAQVIVTPHTGEMSRLTGKKIPFIERHRQKIAQQFSRQWQVSVVLKDAHSLVVYNSKTYINSSGNPGMASGGMGDVLTGMLAAFSAQNIPLEDAVFIHGAAGDLASQEKGEYAMIASDLIEYIPYAIQKYS